MSTGAVIALAGLLFGWSVVSGRLERLDVTGPIVFVAAGLLLCNGPWAVIDVSIESHAVHGLAEITLALLLFADAARVDPQRPPAQRRAPDPPARHRAAADLRRSAPGWPPRCSPICRGSWPRCWVPCWRPPMPR